MTVAPVTPRLSVIVPCRGHGPELAQLLMSLEGQTLPRDRFELIVVDDGSSPRLARLGSTLPVTLLTQLPRGPAAARNRALAIARAPLTLFLNADAVPVPDLLERHLAAHAKGPRAVLGRFDFLARHRTRFVAAAEAIGTLFPYDRLPSGSPLAFQFFWTGNLSAPTQAIAKAGGFDERFERALFEDVELGLRLQQLGLPLVFDDRLACGHDHAIAPAAWVQRCEALGSEWVVFAERHGPTAFPFLGQPEPGEGELWAGVLHQWAAHQRRIDQIGAWAAGADEVATFDPHETLRAIDLIARMSGVLARSLGHTPEDVRRHRTALFPYAVVHTLADARDLALVRPILESLPPGARLLTIGRVGADVLPRDPRLVHVVPSDERWEPLLRASTAEAFVLLDASVIPSTSSLDALVKHLGVNPSLGAIALGPAVGRPEITASLVPADRMPTAVFATTRTALAGDRGTGGTFIERLVERGLRLAVMFPAG